MIDDRERRSSRVVLSAIRQADRAFGPYFAFCKTIDKVYSADGQTPTAPMFSDQEYDLFWASMEILKPAIYAKPPIPVVTPRFKDRNKVATVASELLERCLVSSFDRGDMDQVMLGVRDDLALTNRGVSRVIYETDEKGGGQRVCDEHVDRVDFLHEPARKWSEVGWVAFGAYMSKREMRKRFRKTSGDAYQSASYNVLREDRVEGAADDTKKAKVWEVWHKADNKVYWVSEGVEVMLDESEPFLKLDGFFPCPRPAYGTVKRRSLIPSPDYARYQGNLEQINELTSRIYALLNQVRVKGLIPGGGDVANAVEQLLAQNTDASLLIPVPGAALIGAGGKLVEWLPLDMIATTIQGLIEARGQLIQDFYQLSGISDIMRGATEAEETLGAQRLKSQYGSIRVRDKIDELQRLARDVARISGEIIAEKFSPETMLEMAQMEIPTKAEVEKQLKDLRAQAKKELEAVATQVQGQAQQADPQQVEQQLAQAQQQVLAKFAPQITALSETVTLEDVTKLLRDQKTRSFVIDIETDSTVLVDEQAEKESRAEFLTAFSAASQAVQPLLAAGEAGAALAGGMLKFALGPFRAGRELDGLIDDFVDKAPQALAQQQGGEAEKALAEANQKLADAEMQKAQAQTAKVQADAQGKMQELQLRMAEAQEKARSEQQRFALEVEKLRAQVQETNARTEKIFAEIEAMGFKTQLDARTSNREDIKVAADIQSKQTDQAMAMHDQQRTAVESEREAAMGERQQSFAERQGERSESRADRQQSFSERQAQRDAMNGGAK
jgi:hypothetical protein